jgi:exodeoxyribonuclease VII small subunit
MAEKQPETFEEKIEAAKTILKELSEPDLPLDRATTLHKKGTALLQEASNMLEKAKLEFEENSPAEQD